MIMLDITEEDEKALADIIQQTGQRMPNVKVSIYKNRRGSINRCYLWQYADKGTCRFETLFITDYNYKIISVKDVNIVVKDKQNVLR